jgi:hypothetical protein
MLPVGVPVPPWMWAKARSKLAVLIRLCGDGLVSNEARNSPLLHTEPVLEIHLFCIQLTCIIFDYLLVWEREILSTNPSLPQEYPKNRVCGVVMML